MMRKERKVKAKAANGHPLAEHLPAGQIFTDLYKKQWILGKSIGVGGFGEIYCASNDVSKPAAANAEYVIKVEPHTNGPLFAEIHVYHRVAKGEMIEEWKEKRKLKFLGMPKFVGSGSQDYNGTKYRFMVMERYGSDLQKKFVECGKMFPVKTVLALGLRIIDVLEYLHDCGYVHCDIKASNLLLGYRDKSSDDVYLVDFGLACRYLTDGTHKSENPDPKKAHDGTIEYTSRDAHVGMFSRRGDLEILAYNMLQWSCGKLPWEKDLKDCEGIKAQKNKYLDNVTKLFDDCYKKSNPCPGLKQFFEYILTLKFETTPNYDRCRRIFRDGLKKSGLKDDGKLDFKKVDVDSPKPKRGGKRASANVEAENHVQPSPVKQKRSTSRKPCAPAQSNRVTRSSPGVKTTKVKKSTSPIEKLKKSASPMDNPTPAMLLIMEKKRKKEELKAKKIKNAKRTSPATNSVQKRVTRTARNIEVSPDLF